MLRVLVIRFSYVPLVVVYSVRSIIAWVKSLSSNPRTFISEPHLGQPILLLAVWEKGELRPDIVRLLRSAKNQGMYTFVINTARLTDPPNIAAYVDHYIERVNFGADFGSYKLGFEWILNPAKVQSTPRVIMGNDSVFYISDRIESTLNAHINATHEVLGITENFEYHYHLGSFFISFSEAIRTHPSLKKFWKKYHRSQMRPRNIRLGEMALTKCLLRCVSKREALDSQINVRVLRATLEQTPESVPTFLDHLSSTGLMNEVKEIPTPGEVIRKIFTFFSPSKSSDMGPIRTQTQASKLPENFLDTFEFTSGVDFSRAPQQFKDFATGMVLHTFTLDSQIHNSALSTMLLGIPIIKNDLLYRGAMGSYEAVKLMRMLPEPDRTEFSKMLFDRPYGGDTLHGWKLLAFCNGLI
ncbi:MAG: hypothetical protein F2839_00330 [Actinobacteria bacterium]|uniref:Unannotated protein n=1 Tax=freshwater metagenome TaxID=449393 RepID=A0A6J5YPE2_9ZZZZ|nr:hypothetical protein [Actinomycetota bacterium]